MNDWQTTTTTAVEIRPGCWVMTREIVAVVDDYDDRTAPPRRKGTKVLLRTGDWLTATKDARALLGLMGGKP